MRNLQSVTCLKKALLVIFNFPTSPTLYNFSLNRYSSISHTRIRLDACLLNYYLFRIGCKSSPKCVCGFEVETINHYFLHCPIFAATRLKLLNSAAHILAEEWFAMSDLQKINLFCLDPRNFLRIKMFKSSIMFKILLKNQNVFMFRRFEYVCTIHFSIFVVCIYIS